MRLFEEIGENMTGKTGNRKDRKRIKNTLRAFSKNKT